MSLAASDELNDFDLRARTERRLAPQGLFKDAPVEFYGDARGIQLELFQKAEDRLTVGRGAWFAVYHDFHGHALVDTLVLQPL